MKKLRINSTVKVQYFGYRTAFPEEWILEMPYDIKMKEFHDELSKFVGEERDNKTLFFFTGHGFIGFEETNFQIPEQGLAIYFYDNSVKIGTGFCKLNR